MVETRGRTVGHIVIKRNLVDVLAAESGIHSEYIRALRMPFQRHSNAMSSSRAPALRISPANSGLNACGVTSDTNLRAAFSFSGSAVRRDSCNHDSRSARDAVSPFTGANTLDSFSSFKILKCHDKIVAAATMSTTVPLAARSSYHNQLCFGKA